MVTSSSTTLRGLELGCKARLDNSNILTIGGNLSQLIVRPEVTSSPARPSNEHVSVVVKRIKNVADNLNAVLTVTSTKLSDEGLALVALQERSQGLKSRSQRVIAEGVLAALLVEVLVQLENEVGRATIGVLNIEQIFRAVGEAHGVGPVGRREEDHLGGRAGFADGGDDGLRGRGPFGLVEVGLAITVVGFVHDAEDLQGEGKSQYSVPDIIMLDDYSRREVVPSSGRRFETKFELRCLRLDRPGPRYRPTSDRSCGYRC